MNTRRSTPKNRGSRPARALTVLAIGLGCLAAVPQEEGAPTSELTPVEQADEVLREMGRFLARAERFTYRADVWHEQMLADDVKVQYFKTVAGAVQRPNRLHLSVRGDVDNRELWYDGETVTLYLVEEQIYASAPGRSDIDSTLDMCVAEYDVEFPLQDFALDGGQLDPAAHFVERVYLGLHRLGEVACHHLLLTEPEVDIQIWIEAGERPVPRRLVVTYRNEPAQPELMATFREWDFSPSFGEGHFVFRPPAGVEKVEIVD